MKFGYCRVSTEEQNLDRQQVELESKVDRMYCDKKSGKNTDRPELQSMLMNIRKDDIVLCCSMDRLSRDLKDLISLVEQINSKGGTIQFLKENLTFTPDKDDPFQKLMLSMLGSINEFYRTNQLRIQREGIRIGKLKGHYSKPRKKKLSKEQVEEIKVKLNNGSNISQLSREYGVSRVSLYHYLKG